MQKAFITAVLFFAVVSGAFAETKPKPAAPVAPATTVATPRASNDLPVRRVVLYKNGVGYFEHAGKIRGSQEVNIDFTTGQLNDVLKSLTVVDMSGGQITGVRYNSIAPLSERLRTLRVQLGEDATRAGFLTALRGARVEVRSGGASTVGKLLSVEQIERTTGKDFQEPVTQFAVVTDAGEMRTFDLTPSVSVRVLEGELTQEIGQYMSAISSSRAKDVRRMTIATNGAGDRDLFVSYISEVPVWKSTYRIMLPSKAGEKALLQGWAIVDNTVGEDWKDVQLALVAGSPQSFTQPISQPYYVRRPSIELPKSAMLTPQTHEGTMVNAYSNNVFVANNAPPPPTPSGYVLNSVSGVVTDPTGARVANATVEISGPGISRRVVNTDSSGHYTFGAIPPGNVTIAVSSPGFKTTRNSVYLSAGTNVANTTLEVGGSEQVVEVTGAAPLVSMPALSTGRFDVSGASGAENTFIMEGEIEAADATALGDLFQYSLKQKVTVLKNQSALVPIVNVRIEAEKVTLWNESQRQPLRALWLRNGSGLTLDSGTFNIIDADAFAGEGVLTQLHPDERRLLSFAADTAVRITSQNEMSRRTNSRVRIVRGLMYVTREERESRIYTVRNSDSDSRNVVIEHPARPMWKLAGEVKPEESSENYHRFKVAIEPNSTAKLKVEEVHPIDVSYTITNLNDDLIAMFVRDRTINSQIEQAFRRILDKKNEISSVDSQLASHRREIDDINREQARMRENMKALKGSAEEKALVQRYVGQMNQHEDRLAALTREIAQLDGSRLKLNSELDQMAQEIVLDEKL